MVYHGREWNDYLIPRHSNRYTRKHNQYDIRAGHDGKVGYNTAEYTTFFQCSDWLHFLWHGMKAEAYHLSR